jgi:hypothetical protein
MPEPTIQYVERQIDKAVKLIQKKVPMEEYPVELKECLNRWEVIHRLRCAHMYKGEAFVRAVYKTRFPEINDTSIRLDMRASELFYGRAEAGKREYDRIIHQEFLLKAQYRAFEKGDDKAAAMYAKLYQNYLDPKYDQTEKPDFAELAKAMNITIEFNPELLGVDRITHEAKQQLWDSVQSKLDLEIQDAEFEDMPKSIKKMEAEND